MVSVPLSDFVLPDAERVYGELYEGDTWIQVQETINSLPPGPEGPMENVITALQVYSDATLCANFSGESAWPIYLQFGNDSKYDRARPGLSTTQQIAFIPKLPDHLQDTFRDLFGKSATAKVLSHCKRELTNGVWLLLLDEEFIEAYRHGIVMRCYDGIVRRIFPRFFTYAADYPEK